MPYILGGLALGSGIMGAFGASATASAQAQAAEIAQRQANFRAQWQHEAEQRNAMRAFQANLERNIQIEKGANTERALAELYLDTTFQNQKGTFSKESSTVNAQFINTMNDRGVSTGSGTARALLRQNMSTVEANMIALKTNYRTSYRDIENQQKGRLSQRQFSFQELSVFLPQTGGIADASSTALMTGLIGAGISGLSAGYTGYQEYGWPNWGGGPPQPGQAGFVGPVQ